MWQTKPWLLHHDSALAQKALSIREFLAKNNIAVLKQPPYSPDLAARDFFRFPKVEGVIKRTCFQDWSVIRTAVMKELRVISQESFQECMEEWHRRMKKCIRPQEDYFKGDKL